MQSGAKTIMNLAVITDTFLKRLANIKAGKIKQHWNNNRDQTDIIDPDPGPQQHLKLGVFWH